jgi:prepilin peptidase CpaA
LEFFEERLVAAHQMLWVWAVLISMVAGWLDWRSRRIPNWLTLSGLGVGLTTAGLAMGWPGAQAGLAGTGLALGLLLPLVWLRALGAGDWKLMGALGAALGPAQIVRVLLASIFIAGIMAVAQITWQKRWLSALGNLVELIRGFFVFGLKAHPRITLDNPAMPSLPFGVAVAGATILCSWAGRV